MHTPRPLIATSALLLACSATSGCERRSEASPLATPTRESQAQVSNAVEGKRDPRVVVFEGACDASGAVELDARHFVVADDEDNVLRIYDAERGGPPLFEADLSAELALPSRKAGESDFEAATRIGDRAFFVASHARSNKGRRDANRLVLVATGLPPSGAEAGRHALPLLGSPYRALLDDMTNDRELRHFALHEAAERLPKEPGGLNLEGMTADRDGSLLLGFRNPVPEGRALLVRLLNPNEVVEGARARFSRPILFELDGLGVRALSSWRSSLLVIAGPTGDGGPFRLFRFRDWAAQPDDSPWPLQGEALDVDLDGFGAEAFFTPESRDEIMVLSDDGTRLVGVQPCKKVKDRRAKTFRGVWVKLPE